MSVSQTLGSKKARPKNARDRERHFNYYVLRLMWEYLLFMISGSAFLWSELDPWEVNGTRISTFVSDFVSELPL